MKYLVLPHFEDDRSTYTGTARFFDDYADAMNEALALSKSHGGQWSTYEMRGFTYTKQQHVYKDMLTSVETT